MTNRQQKDVGINNLQSAEYEWPIIQNVIYNALYMDRTFESIYKADTLWKVK